MKRVLLRNVLVGLIIFLSGVGVAQAQNSFSLSVFCSIPAVPGLNAPLIEEETMKTEPTITEQENTKIQNETKVETKEQTPTMLQQDTEKTLLAEGTTSQIIVKTIYSR